ncbi:hypothetical protein IFT72_15125 [Frigoribacterium sp. CFBP 8754]|uniref:hypothetical protein n=1 Tax=Frigoribacterium sp. CFBP 8754 TaxID=2775290 RepID=UPI001784DD82|nr:hypothetical protein [Frigoribacterium sp. CFBP 8754]MBD8661520.1 hypothetical protein [Frigoribacterium sp. CFBP 8754]
MNADTQNALIGFWGVLIGAVLSLVASVVVPWVRDVLDRKRVAREVTETERQEWLLSTIAALLEVRQTRGGEGYNPSGAAMAKFGNALNQLTVRLAKDEQPVLDVIVAMLAMVQEPRPGVEMLVGESMVVLTLWVRGDISTDHVIREVEARAGVMFSDDRKTVGVVRKPA